MVNYLGFASKNLRRRGIRSWLTLVGIFIGIAAVIALITLGTALRMAVIGQFGISSTEVITVQAGGMNNYGPPGSGVVKSLTIQDAEAIGKLDTVEIAVGRKIEYVKAEFNNKQEISYSASLPEGKARDFIYKTLDVKTAEGRLMKDGDSGKVMLGNRFLDKDKNGFGKEIHAGDKILIQGKKFEVVGILDRKGSFIIDQVIIVNEKDLKDLIGYGDKTDIIAVKIKNKDLMDKAKADIEKLMRQRRDVKIGEEDFDVATPQAALATVNSILNGIQIFIIIIASISIIVGAIGIINTMTTAVLERKKEIGIMKSIGARNSAIFFLFCFESGLLGIVGGAMGIIAGLIFGYVGVFSINYFLGTQAKINLNLWLIFFTLFGSFLIGSIAGVIPALRAARQNPVEALRN
jgi:putative ABC transport system permease protein